LPVVRATKMMMMMATPPWNPRRSKSGSLTRSLAH
jgi:hypothetical protein